MFPMTPKITGRPFAAKVLALAAGSFLLGYFGCIPDTGDLTDGHRQASGSAAQGGDCSSGTCAGDTSTGGSEDARTTGGKSATLIANPVRWCRALRLFAPPD